MPQTKQQLRIEMKARRAAMSADEVAIASGAIRRRVLDLDQLRDARCVFTYVSIHNEPDTRKLIHDLLAAGKRVSVPRLGPDGLMQAHQIDSLDDLLPAGPDQFGIPVPASDSPIEPHPGVALVPGLAFTEAGNRLGLGGGHYDRYLANHPGTLAIGLCFGWQVVNTLPAESHDQPIQMLVTDSRVIPCCG